MTIFYELFSVFQLCWKSSWNSSEVLQKKKIRPNLDFTLLSASSPLTIKKQILQSYIRVLRDLSREGRLCSQFNKHPFFAGVNLNFARTSLAEWEDKRHDRTTRKRQTNDNERTVLGREWSTQARTFTRYRGPRYSQSFALTFQFQAKQHRFNLQSRSR